jgi:hypothetical protein
MTTNHPEIDRLRAINPIPTPPDDPAAAERLLREVLAQPRRSPRVRRRSIRPRVHPRIVLPTLIAATAAILVAIASVGEPQSLAARAYSATDPGNGVLYEIVSSVTRTEGGHPGQVVSQSVGAREMVPPNSTERITGWYQPATGRAHVIQTGVIRTGPIITASTPRNGSRPTHSEIIVRADGSMTLGGSSGHIIGLHAFANGATDDNSLVTGDIARDDFVQEFRRAYRAGLLAKSQTTRFDGKPAVEYQNATPLTGLAGPSDTATIEWFIDPQTAQPLGSIEQLRIAGVPGVTFVTTKRLDQLARLAPTPQNLARLTANGQ